MAMRHAMLAVAALLMGGTMAHASDGDLRSIAGMQHHDRVLLVFAPSLADPRLKLQQREFSRAALQMSERAVVLVQVAGDTVIGAHDVAAKLRDHYHVPAPAYRTVLIGKDGAAALTVDGPLRAARIMAAIDAMPMRQEEIRRARAGEGRPTP